MEEFLVKAIEVAWKMLTIQPPMIATFPTEHKYDRSLHDKDGDNWDSSLKSSDYELVFFNPALYYTYQDKKPQVLAEVGNRKRKT